MIAILFTASIAGAQVQEEDHTGHNHAPGGHSTSIENREGVSTNQDASTVNIGVAAEDIAPPKMPPIPVRLADSIIVANMAPLAQAERFGKVVVQDDGRMKPLSTLASESCADFLNETIMRQK